MAKVAKNSHYRGGGSKPGERRGGRGKGTRNKRTVAQSAAAVADGISPLDYMLSVMRDIDAEPYMRAAMAKAAAPYVHPHLATIEHSGPGGGAIQHRHAVSPEQVRDELRGIFSAAAEACGDRVVRPGADSGGQGVAGASAPSEAVARAERPVLPADGDLPAEGP